VANWPLGLEIALLMWYKPCVAGILPTICKFSPGLHMMQCPPWMETPSPVRSIRETDIMVNAIFRE